MRPNVAGKEDRGNGRKHRRVHKFEVARDQGQDFGTDADLVFYLPMSGVEVLEYEHTIVALEIMEDHDDTSFLAVFIDGETVQMLKHGLYAVFPIEGYGVLAFFIFETEEDGCLYTFFVSDG